LLDQRKYLGTVAIVALVFLRLAIGWHFFKDGSQKFQSDRFSAAGFLWQAKGPLAPLFHRIAPPPKQPSAWLDVESTLADWDDFRYRAVQHYGFDDQQLAAVDSIVAARTKQLREHVAEYREEIDTYLLSFERIDRDRSDPVTGSLTSLRAHADRNEGELAGVADEWVAVIRQYWRSLEHDVNTLANDDQRGLGAVTIERTQGTLQFVDAAMPYFITTIGVLLVIGLFARPAAIAAALFLFSIVMTQFPGAEGAEPVYYQVIEMAALVVIAAVGAGRFAGLDFFLHFACARYCCRGRRSKAEQGDSDEFNT